MRFYFISSDEKTIGENIFIVIRVFEEKSNYSFSLYKKKSSDIINLVTHMKKFEDITNHVFFAIRNNGKIVLDIK